MKITLRKLTGRKLFIQMDAKEQIVAAGVDPTGQFIITSGWDNNTATIWHDSQIPAGQRRSWLSALHRTRIIKAERVNGRTQYLLRVVHTPVAPVRQVA